MDKITKIKRSIDPIVSLTNETVSVEETEYKTKKFQWEISLKIAGIYKESGINFN